MFTCKPQYDSPGFPQGMHCPNGTSTVFEAPGCTQLCTIDGMYPCTQGTVCEDMETLNPTCIPQIGACLPPSE